MRQLDGVALSVVLEDRRIVEQHRGELTGDNCPRDRDLQRLGGARRHEAGKGTGCERNRHCRCTNLAHIFPPRPSTCATLAGLLRSIRGLSTRSRTCSGSGQKRNGVGRIAARDNVGTVSQCANSTWAGLYREPKTCCCYAVVAGTPTTSPCRARRSSMCCARRTPRRASAASSPRRRGRRRASSPCLPAATPP